MAQEQDISFEWDDVQTIKDLDKEIEMRLTIAAVSRIKAERKHEALNCTCAINHEVAENKAAKDE